ncbi:nitroreductase family deazaflavin-dependent oxidoreductase [Kribbella sandramycini]|uniref:Deazaflavin-dependent oxidoreductase (Nitroreductase family) n=1 Tax=Kribbella sandramycini TaxID=60450 RepID=A0A7Y4KYF6_9ACTN|nr:nitroreductase family deazaflavin-dependent oxidoreductase [Kribbella sandramycini]MBB6569919.1 deazaflavin-dependent oxidoreductase (nitroreductase family) [Kribbella sandramycini]NOL40257.1 nitroreductase family deazaflavin-dependent oxidoreductase [Kribbella sandramycini]
METTTKRKPGTPGPLSRWMQRTMGARMVRKVRRGRANFMGMDVLVLTTVGRRTGQRRETALSWFPDGPDSWLIVGSGGGSQNPDWHANLLANPEAATIELPGRGVLEVTPERLEAEAYDGAWAKITQAQPRYAKYQAKSDRRYPVVRLTARG